MEHPTLITERLHSGNDTTTPQGRIASCTFARSGATHSAMDDLAHEVRQPLSVIESLAYYLELTATDEKVRVHLQRIQAMVLQANLILKRNCRPEATTAVAR
jgi:signal transduction histidine kinase